MMLERGEIKTTTVTNPLDFTINANFVVDEQGTYLQFRGKLQPPYAGQEFLGMNFMDIFPREVANQHLATVQSVIASGRSRAIEFALNFSDTEAGYYRATFQKSGPRLVTMVVMEITGFKMIQQALIERNYHDGLTGLVTRERFIDELLRIKNEAYLNRSSFPLYYIDIDFFKEINDSLGHLVGDEVLVEVARALNLAVNNERTVIARLGGDELGIIDPDIHHDPDGDSLAERILKEISAIRIEEAPELIITASVGYAFYNHNSNGVAPTEVMKWADDALYLAKNAGRNRFARYQHAQRPAGVN